MSRLRGQSSIEFVILLIGAGMAMALFFGAARNAVSYRFKAGADGVGHGMRYR